jgi:hypothetical protein
MFVLFELETGLEIVAGEELVVPPVLPRVAPTSFGFQQPVEAPTAAIKKVSIKALNFIAYDTLNH